MSKKETTPKFTQVQHALYECVHFDLIEINIIARIASWQRKGFVYFESKSKTAELLKTTRPTLDTRFDRLISLGIIIKGKKRGRASEYRIHDVNLDRFLKWSKENPDFNICKATLHKVPTFVKSPYIDCKATLHYNNNDKTILYKNSFIDDEEDLASSSSKEDPLTDEEKVLLIDLNDFDI